MAQVEEDPTGGKYAGAASALNGAPHKLESIIQFHVGDVVTSLQRAVMQPGGQESIMYGTVMGAIGMVLPPCTVHSPWLFTTPVVLCCVAEKLIRFSCSWTISLGPTAGHGTHASFKRLSLPCTHVHHAPKTK